MTAVTRMQAVCDGILNTSVPAAQLLRIADAFVAHEGEDAIQAAFGVPISALTNEQKAQVFLAVMKRAGKAVLVNAARTPVLATAQADADSAAASASADMEYRP